MGALGILIAGALSYVYYLKTRLNNLEVRLSESEADKNLSEAVTKYEQAKDSADAEERAYYAARNDFIKSLKDDGTDNDK